MVGRLFAVVFSVLWLAGTTSFARSQTPEPTPVILFENVRIFDGKGDTLSGQHERSRPREHDRENLEGSDSIRPLDVNTKSIAGGGRTLMPGLIDMHWHTMLVRPTPAALLVGDIGHLNLMAGAEATDTLMRGFTTVRDLGGPAFGLKRAIDEGILPGPRIYPSGADHHRHQRAWRLPPAVRGAARPWRPAVPRGADRCCHDRGQSG